MKIAVLTAACMVAIPIAFIAALAPAAAQTPSDTGTTKPMSAVPPVSRSSHSGKDTSDVANGPSPAGQAPLSRTQAPGSAIPPSREMDASGKITPKPAYEHGTAQVGNSTEANGVPGTSGAGASATMQSGHLNNR